MTRLQLMLAIERAQATGFPHLAAALAELLRRYECRRNSIPISDSMSAHK